MYNYLEIKNYNVRIETYLKNVYCLHQIILDIDFKIYKQFAPELLNNFKLVTITHTKFRKPVPNKLNIYLIYLSTISELDIKKIDELTIATKFLYVDFYIDRICNIKILSKILLKLNKKNIRVCYTYENIKNRLKFDKYIFKLFSNYSNYYSFQKMITRDLSENKKCTPRAIKIDAEKMEVSFSCGIPIEKINSFDLLKYFDKSIECSIRFCSQGDSVNKENNYNNFYKDIL